MLLISLRKGRAFVLSVLELRRRRGRRWREQERDLVVPVLL